MSEQDTPAEVCQNDTPQTALVPQPHGGAIYSNGRPPGYTNPNAGRPTNLETIPTKTINAICRDFELGLRAEQVCALNGVSRSVFYSWLKKGEENQSPIYREFVDKIAKSRAIPEQRALEIIWEHANGKQDGGKNAQWINEHLYPERYSKRQTVAHMLEPQYEEEW